jgi:hypothetical protein
MEVLLSRYPQKSTNSCRSNRAGQDSMRQEAIKDIDLPHHSYTPPSRPAPPRLSSCEITSGDNSVRCGSRDPGIPTSSFFVASQAVLPWCLPCAVAHAGCSVPEVPDSRKRYACRSLRHSKVGVGMSHRAVNTTLCTAFPSHCQSRPPSPLLRFNSYSINNVLPPLLRCKLTGPPL